MFSVVLGSAAVFLLYCLVRRLAGGTAGLVAASLFAVSQMGVAYSQETRAYALLFVLAIGAAWLLDVALTERRGWAWYAFCFVSAALALTHYHALWILIALWGVALCAPLAELKAFPARWWTLGLGLSIGLVVPWIAAGGLSVLFETREGFAEMPSYFSADWRTFYHVLGSYDNARWPSLMSAPPSGTALVGLFVYGLPAVLALYPFFLVLLRRAPLNGDERGLVLLGAASLVCMAGPVIMSIVLSGVPYDIRYTSPGIGFYCGLVAIGVMRLEPRRVRWQAVTLMLTFGLISFNANYFKPYKENWRDSLAWVAGSVRPGDVAVFVPFGSPPNAWEVYHPAGTPLSYAPLGAVLERQPSGRVWLLAYGRVEWAAKQGRDASAALERKGYKLVERRDYHWITASIWERSAVVAAGDMQHPGT